MPVFDFLADLPFEVFRTICSIRLPMTSETPRAPFYRQCFDLCVPFGASGLIKSSER